MKLVAVVVALLVTSCLQAQEEEELDETVQELGSPCDPAPNPCTQAINCGAWTSWAVCSSACDEEVASCPGVDCWGVIFHPGTVNVERRRRGCTDPSKPLGQRACQQTQTRTTLACGCDDYGPPYCGPI